MEQTPIIERLSLMCEHFRLSPSALADKSGISPSNYSKMIKGEQRITDKTLKKIAETFGVSFEWLLNGDGEMLIPSASPYQYARGENIRQTGNNSNNIRNSTELFSKALDEIAAQRELTQRTQKLLEEAAATNRELTLQILEMVKRFNS